MSEAIVKDSNVVFKNLEVLVKHLFSLEQNLSPIKLQKSLYFLFAYYGATYGSIGKDLSNDNKIEETTVYPKYLFNANFEAWKYGPVIHEVYSKNKDNGYEAEKYEPVDSKETEVLSYLNETFKQLNEISDFGLVERSHLDKSWKEPYSQYKEGETTSQGMNSDSIIEEYRNEYL